MMEFYVFVKRIKAELEELCGKDYTVETREVFDNNGTVDKGMSIRRAGTKEFPVVSLNMYYEHYLEGLTAHEIAKDIWDMFNSFECSEVEESILMDFDKVKDKVIFKLISYERNQKLLENMPYVMYCDLAIIFNVLLERDEKGQMTVPIHNYHIKLWGITEEELYQLAKKNTPKLYHAELTPMDELMEQLKRDEGENSADDFYERTVDFNAEISPLPLYILSNTSLLNGATVILYDGLLRNIAEEMESDLILLPSSIHEIIILPDIEGLDIKVMEENVRWINKREVAVKDVLSDNIYKYNKEKDNVYLISIGIQS